MTPYLITAPAAEPVSLAELKAAVEVDFADRDDLLQSCLDAAVSHLDGWRGVLGRCLIEQVWALPVAAWSPLIPLPFIDVSAVVVKYRDMAGAELTLDAAVYELIPWRGRQAIRPYDAGAMPDLWSQPAYPVTVEMTVGYGPAAEDVPPALRKAVKLLAAHWFRHREAVGEGAELPFGVSVLTAPHRVRL